MPPKKPTNQLYADEFFKEAIITVSNDKIVKRKDGKVVFEKEL